MGKWTSSSGGQGKGSLLSHAGHGLLGGVFQVGGRSDGEPAAAKDALGLVDVGSWEGAGAQSLLRH